MSMLDSFVQNWLASPAAQAGLAAAEAAGLERRKATLELLEKLVADSRDVDPKKVRDWLQAEGAPLKDSLNREDSPLDRVLLVAGHGVLLRAFGMKAGVAAFRWVADKLEQKAGTKNGQGS